MSEPIHHQLALGIHPGAFVQHDPPDVSTIQDGTLWVDTSVGPPYQLKAWFVAGPAWRAVGIVSVPTSGVDAGGNLLVDCLTFPLGASICNDATDVVHIDTGGGLHALDDTGYTLPGGHRLEVVSSA